MGPSARRRVFMQPFTNNCALQSRQVGLTASKNVRDGKRPESVFCPVSVLVQFLLHPLSSSTLLPILCNKHLQPSSLNVLYYIRMYFTPVSGDGCRCNGEMHLPDLVASENEQFISRLLCPLLPSRFIRHLGGDSIALG